MKYDIEHNPPPLQSEDILKHKNFDALFAQFEAHPQSNSEIPNNLAAPTAPISKIPIWLGWSAGLVAASVALFFLVKNVIPAENNSVLFTTPLALQSPINVQKSFTTFSIENTDTLLTAKSGSTIKIPASAFVNKDGKAITGKVDIQYKELHDHVDMFLAGLPQTSKHKNRQTAAAIQIQGYQNGEAVYINKDKNLQVALHTNLPKNIEVAQLQIFSYDKVQDNWNYQIADKVEIVSNNQNNNNNTAANDSNIVENNYNLNSEKELLAQLDKRFAKPLLPTKQNKSAENREVFDIDFAKEEFPEFANLQNILWVATEKDIPYQQKDKNRDWHTMKINQNKDGSYQLFLKDNNGELSFKVEPIASNVEEAEKLYQNQMADYQLKLKNRQKSIANELQTWRNSSKTIAKDESNQIVIHYFNVNQFGLWACTNENIVLTTHTVQNTKNDLTQIYLATPDNRFYQSINVASSLHVPNDAMVWAVDKNRKLWIATTENNQLVFTETAANTEQEVRILLKSKEFYN